MPLRHIHIMDLKAYIEAHGLTTQAMAAAIGVSQPFAWRLVEGKREPSPEIAIRIEEWTEGQVKAACLNKALAKYEEMRVRSRSKVAA